VVDIVPWLLVGLSALILLLAVATRQSWSSRLAWFSIVLGLSFLPIGGLFGAANIRSIRLLGMLNLVLGVAGILSGGAALLLRKRDQGTSLAWPIIGIALCVHQMYSATYVLLRLLHHDR
jgi:hypothetical protein